MSGVLTAVHGPLATNLHDDVRCRRAAAARDTPCGVKRVLGLLLFTALLLPACTKEKPPEDIEALIARNLEDGDSLLRNSKLDEAEEKFKWVLEQRADDVAALTGLGRIELARENPSGALDPLKKAVAAKADDPLAQASLGRALAGTKDWAGAAEHLGKAWELDKDEDQYGLEYGIALRENKQFEQAVTTFEEVADSNPKIKYVYRELAHTHKAAGDLDKALRTYMKAQSAWAGDQDSYAGAAMVYEEQGEVTKSIDQWAKYIQQDCCSTYSKDVAQPKLAELKAKENAGDSAAPTEPPAEAPTEG
jgi:tetratricopeptide (TPR) repeat protein